MRKIELLKTLERRPLFTFNEFVRIAGKPQKYARTYLYRLKKEGLVFSVEKGKYTTLEDPLAFSSHIAVPSYISFWTALMLHHLTEQLPRDIMLASPKPKKTVVFRGTRIRFFKTKHMWGYKKERHGDFEMFLAEKEKCIIDSLLLKNVPFDEIAKAVGTKELDRQRLVEYALKAGNKSLMKRLGYVMEHYGMDAGELARHLDNNPVLLDWSGERHGKLDKKWKTVANRRLDDIS